MRVIGQQVIDDDAVGFSVGAETARRAASRGYSIAINYRTRDAEAKKVVAAVEASGAKAIAIKADMASEADIVRMFEETTKALGPITHLANSAGINGRRGRVDEYDAAALANLFATNVTGLMLCCREAARRMSTKHGGKGGAIVNVSSMAATLGGRLGSSAYAASKGAVDAFTKGFAREVAAEGIRVNSLRPGMALASLPCGAMDDLLSLDLTGISGLRLSGVDLDPAALRLARHNHARRHHLIVRGVGGVPPPRKAVEQHVARDMGLEPPFQAWVRGKCHDEAFVPV